MEQEDLLYKYISSLEESIQRIKHMDFTFDMILGDEDTQDLLDRRMQKAVESCMDIAIHLASQLQLPRSEKASDIFILLAKNRIIDQALAEKLKQAVGFRNILVHEYTEVDYKLAYTDLDEKLSDLETFAYQIREFLKKQKNSAKH